jgi:hypothetical protein
MKVRNVFFGVEFFISFKLGKYDFNPKREKEKILVKNGPNSSDF